jgi:3-isopropylmalate/(R)-2-methylmalate dehydratase small subunit
MTITGTSTFTSGVLAIAKDVKRDHQETLDINIVKADPDNNENILVVDVDCNKVSNYDEIVKSICDMGFGVVISDVFTDIFSAKALSQGLLTIEVSRKFLSKIMSAGKESAIKLFIDLKGQEVMIIDTGEKEYFQMSDYNRDSMESGKDDVENLYEIWDGIGDACRIEETMYYTGDFI